MLVEIYRFMGSKTNYLGSKNLKMYFLILIDKWQLSNLTLHIFVILLYD